MAQIRYIQVNETTNRIFGFTVLDDTVEAPEDAVVLTGYDRLTAKDIIGNVYNPTTKQITLIPTVGFTPASIPSKAPGT